jgi:hypothetical protein
LSDRIAEAAAGTALAWLCEHPSMELPETAVWDLDLSEAPRDLRTVVDHARRFSVAINGANILYNLLLAEKRGDDDRIERYRRLFASWAVELDASRALADWDRADWWATILRQNPRVSPGAQRFVNAWLDLIGRGLDVADDQRARTLVAEREMQIKHGRARLTNQAALDAWNGDSGMGRLTFRWGIARRHLQDLAAGREHA